MDEMRLRQDVLDELAFEPSIDASNICVTVDRGVVRLSGAVPNFAQKSLAEHAAQRVRGVRGLVAEALEVANDVGDVVSDDDIARRALTLLDLNVLVPRGAIQIKVAHGWLALTGEVEWDFQRLAAIEDLRKLRGVRGIEDAISRRRQPETGDVKQCIDDALRRSADIKACAIQISVCHGFVRLDGFTDSWASRARLERTAWSAPGVHHVEDRVEIG